MKQYKEYIMDWIYKKIDDYINDPDEGCIDNYRWANKNNKKEVKEYNLAREQGCCGFMDIEVKCPIDGKIYLIGCNYGH